MFAEIGPPDDLKFIPGGRFPIGRGVGTLAGHKGMAQDNSIARKGNDRKAEPYETIAGWH